MPALPKDVNLDPHDDSAWDLLLAAEDAVLNKDTKYLDELVGVCACEPGPDGNRVTLR